MAKCCSSTSLLANYQDKSWQDSGNFADELGEDFLGLRDLGIAREHGMDSLSVPTSIFYGRKKRHEQNHGRVFSPSSRQNEILIDQCPKRRTRLPASTSVRTTPTVHMAKPTSLDIPLVLLDSSREWVGTGGWIVWSYTFSDWIVGSDCGESSTCTEKEGRGGKKEEIT